MTAATPDQTPVRVAVLGCGNVGAALAELLTTRVDQIAERTGVRFELAGVAVHDLGRPRPPFLPTDLLTDDPKELVERPGVDVVVELIGGIDPARTLVESALRAGRPVVTANKALLAAAGAELAELAAANRVDLLYEASVAGAIPVIRPLRESLAGERVVRVMGIVNGTTNYILTRMAEDGMDYADALAEAQSLGLAERDPTADVAGDDAAAKAAILAGLAFGSDVVGDDVHREGITGVRAVDVAYAARLGYVVKLLAVAELVPGDPVPGGPVPGETVPGETVDGPPDVSVRVHPAMVPRSHPLASVRGAFNAVFVEGEAAGELMLYGRGAGGAPTASAVLGDLIDAARNLAQGAPAPAPRRGPTRVRPMDELRSAFYLNLEVADRPGVLAAVATVFGNHQVSIRTMEQEGLGGEARLIFLTHTAREGDVRATLDDLRQLEAVDRVGAVLRVVDGEAAE
ncbi:MAG TPA: homoserine dehydrogenase [Acidimicrobiales bacterium]|nr:homoserine dehydrogenase [Acidimicrobiales bacterium]